MTPTSRWKVSYTPNLVGTQDRFWGLVTHSEVMNELHKKPYTEHLYTAQQGTLAAHSNLLIAVLCPEPR